MTLKNPEVHDIFRVPVYEFQLDIDNYKLYNYCNEYKKSEKGRIISNLGGYQSNPLDLNEPALQPLLKQIKLNVNTLKDSLCELLVHHSNIVIKHRNVYRIDYLEQKNPKKHIIKKKIEISFLTIYE